MKIKALTFVAGIVVAASMITSCLSSEEPTYSTDYSSSIRAFSVKSIRETKVYKDSKGNDSIALDTVNSSIYPFTINQDTRIIENKDSMPVHTRKDKVLIKILADTQAIYYTKNGKDTVWNEADSIDFTQEVKFKVVSTAFSPESNSFFVGKPYYIRINVHTVEPDSMHWSQTGNNYIQGNGFGCNLTKQKAVYANNTAYVFGENNGTPCIKYATVNNGDLSDWQDLNLGSITGIDTYSAINYDGTICFKAQDEVYAISDNTIVPNKNEDIKAFYKGYTKISRTFTSTKSMPHNMDIKQTVILQQGEKADTAAKVSLFIPRNGVWKQNEYRKGYVCPNFENISMLQYDKKLIAFGGAFGTDKPAFEKIYTSADNGITWEPVTKSLFFPKEFADYYNTYHQNYSTFVDINSATGKDNYIWIVWEDGTYCKGRINRLGFKPKEWN